MALVAAALAVAYLYILNGRYSHIGNEYYFDKWARVVIIPDEKYLVK